jgi:hypothetical protein
MEPHAADRDPNLVISRLSRSVAIDRVTVEVQIYRLEQERQWTREVVNDAGTVRRQDNWRRSGWRLTPDGPMPDQASRYIAKSQLCSGSGRN